MPEPVPTPTKSASTPTPTKTTGSSATPAPSVPAKTTPTPSLSAYDELDALYTADEPASSAPEDSETPPEDVSDKKPTKAASTPDKPPKPTEKSPDKKAPTEPDQPKEGEPKPFKAAELRNAYESLKKRHKELETELNTLKTQPRDDPEKKSLLTRIEDLEKNREELLSKLQIAAYEHHPEYEEKHQKPIQRAFEQAYTEVRELKIMDANGNERAATPEDFNALVQLPLAQAVQAAKAFGDAGQEILAHRRRILELNENRKQALTDAKTRYESTLKEQSAFQTQRQTWWHDENKAAEEKYPKWSQPDEDDPKESQILTRATELAQRAFAGNGQIPPKDQVRLHSAIYNKARWFDLLAYRAAKTEKALRTEIDTLKTKLAEFEASTPDQEDTTRRGRAPVKSNTWEDELAQLDQ